MLKQSLVRSHHLTEESKSFKILSERISKMLKTNEDTDEKLKDICQLLRDNVSHYDWVGVYMVNKKRKQQLQLGPYVGETTEHTRIRFGSGICGQAAQRKKTFVVQDVSKETNYLSCSTKVKSEIVVPIFKNRKVIGEIDIDSHKISPFTKEDETFLRKVSKMVSKIL